MSDKITTNDVFESDFLEKSYQAVEKITQGFKDMADQIGKVTIEQKEFLQGFKVTSAADIKKLNDELAKAQKNVTELNNANKAATQGDIELAKIRQAQAKALQEEEKAAQQKLKTEKLANSEKQKTLTLYQQESKLLRDLKNEYRNVALAQGQTSKSAQDLLAKITPLDAKLKQLDKTTGDNFRNVGNYKEALQGVGNAFNNILGAAGISLSVDGIFSLGKAILNTRAEFQKFEAVLTNTLGSKSQADEALNRIQEFAAKTPFGVKELTEDFVKLANTGFKPTIKEMTKLGDLASSQGKSFDQLTEALIDAQTGEFERLKEFGIRAKKEGDKVTLSFKDQKIQVDNNNESIRQAILGFGELQGVAGGMSAISDTLGGKISNLNDNWDALLNNLGENSEGAFGAVIDWFNELLSTANEAQKSINDINKILKQEGVQQTFFEKLSNTGAVYGAALKKAYVDPIKQASIETNNFGAGINALGVIQAQLSERFKSGAISAKDYEIQSAVLRDGVKDLKEASASYNEELQKQADKTKELTKAQKKLAEENAKKAADDEKKLRRLIEDKNVAAIINDQQREEAKAALDYKRAIEDVKNSKATSETKKELLLAIDLEYYNKLADIENKYIDKRESEEKARKDKERKADEDAFNEAVKEAERLTAIEDKKREEDAAKLKKQREEDLKNLFDLSNKALDIAEKEIKEKDKLRQDALEKELQDAEKNLDYQRQRALDGLENNIADAERAVKDAEARKEAEAQKAIKREKEIAFFKLLSANAEKDPNSALQKTITEMLLGEALVKGFFFKGTEKVEDDLKGNKVHNGRDGYVVAVDGSERVLTGEQNKLIGKMSNEELAQLAYDYNNKLLPNYMISNAVNPSFSDNIYSSLQLKQMVKMNERLESLEEAINNKPVPNLSLDNLGYIIQKEIKNGFATTTKKPLTKGYGN